MQRKTEDLGKRVPKTATDAWGVLGTRIENTTAAAQTIANLYLYLYIHLSNEWNVSHVRNHSLLRQGLPRSSLPGFPLGRGEDAEEKARRGARTMRARSLSAQVRAVSEPPERPRVVTRAWMPA